MTEGIDESEMEELVPVFWYPGIRVNGHPSQY